MPAQLPNIFSGNARGKLLLTGEYFVVDGCKALAIPLRFGQSLNVTAEGESGFLNWNSMDRSGNVWLDAQFDLKNFDIVSANEKSALKLREVLLTARELNPTFLQNRHAAISVTIKSDFNLNWGFGSSSTLIYLMSKWAKCNPYELQFRTFGGSGYDIACAAAKGPILYERFPKPNAQSVEFNPPFADQLYLVYRGNKQNSKEAVDAYKKLSLDKKPIIEELELLNTKWLQANRLIEMQEIMLKHEAIISGQLQLQSVNRLYQDLPGVAKSLGAWGGDFMLLASDKPLDEITKYFNGLGISTIFKWKEIVLSKG